MTHSHSPHGEQMAHESMVRNLAAQAEAIWPQEVEILRGYRLPERPSIVDVGCGTGEISRRLAALVPGASVVGLDLIAAHLKLAREAAASLASRLHFHRGTAFALPYADDRFDLTVCRHLLQAVPHPERVLAELIRVTRPGGRIHVIAEDYGMIYLHPTRLGAETFWAEAPAAFGRATGTDLFVGRHFHTMLRAAHVEDITAHYLAVDTLRVPRATFARIWEAWRDGYSDAIAEHSRFTRDEVIAHFDDMIACIRDPDGYALWLVPLFSAVVK
jgi:SAM-dependent methyltransferase